MAQRKKADSMAVVLFCSSDILEQIETTAAAKILVVPGDWDTSLTPNRIKKTFQRDEADAGCHMTRCSY